jgi:hypothetical protein
VYWVLKSGLPPRRPLYVQRLHLVSRPTLLGLAIILVCFLQMKWLFNKEYLTSARFIWDTSMRNIPNLKVLVRF